MINNIFNIFTIDSMQNNNNIDKIDQKLDELLLKVKMLKSKSNEVQNSNDNDSIIYKTERISSTIDESSIISDSLELSKTPNTIQKNIEPSSSISHLNPNQYVPLSNTYQYGLSDNDFIFLRGELVLSFTRVLLEKYKTASRVEMNQVPRGYLIVTTNRLFFLCEGMGESISKNMAKHLGAFIFNGIQMNMVDSGIDAATTSLMDLDDSKTISIFEEIPSWLDKTKSFVAPISNIRCERIKTTFGRGITKNFIRFYIPLNDNSFEYYILYLVNPTYVSQVPQLDDLIKSLEQNNIKISVKKYDDDELSYY